MKICLVTFDFPPLIIGGIATQSYDLAYYLSEEGVAIDVLCADENNEDESINNFFRVIRLKCPISQKLLRFPIFQYKVWRWLREHNSEYDIIHFQEGAGLLYLILDGNNPSYNEKTIETFHHDPIFEFLIHLKFFFRIPKETVSYLFMPLKIAEMFVSLKRAKRIVTVSNVSRSTLIAWGIKKDKICVIPNGISVLPLKREFRKNQGRNVKFLYVGRLVPRKGIDILIEAVRILEEKGTTGFEVDIVGDGPLSNYCREKITLNKLQSCKLWGIASPKDLEELYLQSDCFICPSRLEGFGIVLLEAASHHLAILANEIPIFREIFSNGEALFFNQDNPIDLAEKILMLLENQSKIGEYAEKSYSIVNDYQWKKIVKQYIKLYGTMLSEGIINIPDYN